MSDQVTMSLAMYEASKADFDKLNETTEKLRDANTALQNKSGCVVISKGFDQHRLVEIHEQKLYSRDNALRYLALKVHRQGKALKKLQDREVQDRKEFKAELVDHAKTKLELRRARDEISKQELNLKHIGEGLAHLIATCEWIQGKSKESHGVFQGSKVRWLQRHIEQGELDSTLGEVIKLLDFFKPPAEDEIEQRRRLN